MMRVIVKGTPDEVRAACHARAITMLDVWDSEIESETHFDVSDAYRDKIVAWFCEPPFGAPYPAGTCLYYSEVK